MQIARLFKIDGQWACEMVDNPRAVASGNCVKNAVNNLNQFLKSLGREPLPVPYE